MPVHEAHTHTHIHNTHTHTKTQKHTLKYELESQKHYFRAIDLHPARSEFKSGCNVLPNFISDVTTKQSQIGDFWMGHCMFGAGAFLISNNFEENQSQRLLVRWDDY